jgi:cytochrome c oxidase subunit 2
MSPSHLISRQMEIFVLASAVLFVAIVTTTVMFLIRYNRKRSPVAADIRGNLPLEIAWIVVPTILVMGMFFMGLRGYRALRDVPEGAMNVRVTAFEYGWQFDYDNGKRSQQLVVPVKRPVRLELTSKDVIHSFFAPDFRVKMDCVPGMKTQAWFVADSPGEFNVLCAEYCGVGHSGMLSKIVAVPAERFDAWLASKTASAP